MNGLTVDFAHTSARGKILIKPYPEIADEGNTVGLISESPPCLIQAGPCSAVGGNLLKRNSVCFCVTYLESVGDHPGSNVSDTSFRCSEPIMLRGCRQLLEGKYSWISSAYEWILVRWFLTTLKIPATYMIDKIGPMQLPCRTPKSISKLLKEFWLTRTHRARQDRKGEFHFFALPTTSKSISKISYVLLQWRAERRSIFLKQTLKIVYFKGSGMKYLNMNLCKWSVPLALTKTNSLEIRQPNGDIFYGQSLESQFIRRIIQDNIVN